MEYISSAGVAWLTRHGLNIDRMIGNWKQGRSARPQPKWIDDQIDPEAHPKQDGDIRLQNDLWQTHQYLDRIRYRELGTRHAKLEIDRLQLPETVLASVGILSPRPLGSIFDIPQECIASEAMGEVIRILNRPDNVIELLMRIKWHPITTPTCSNVIDYHPARRSKIKTAT